MSKDLWFVISIELFMFVCYAALGRYRNEIIRTDYASKYLDPVMDGLRRTIFSTKNFPNMDLFKFSLFILFIQCFLFLLFLAFGAYTLIADASSLGNSINPTYGGFNHQAFNVMSRFHPMFQDIHVMIFVGFGFLMVFLKKYGYSSLGFNFLLAALVVQWSILCQGFYELNSDYKIEIGLTNLYKADVATATVLISMGAVLGRTSHNQLVLMGLLEIAAYCLNNEINVKYLKAVDVGGSITIHTFGAYFGLAVSYVLAKKHQTEEPNLPQSSYTSNILAMLGTIFLWVYWPSFNSIDLEKDRAHRAIVNTYLSLAASCVVTFAASQMGSKNHKFDIVHIQNSTLAGGVAIGACAHLMVQPYGAVFIGMIAGLFSVYGYTTISAFLESKFKILDTCGVNNLHGIPGILGGLISIIMAAIATEQQYQKTLYEVFPARANPIISQNPEYIHLQAGDGRSASQQAGYQALLIIVTISIAIVSGLISGICLMNFSLWNNISPDSFYDDSVFWDLQVNDDVETDYRPTKWRVKEKNISKISVQ